ncbi:hypothetical protein [Candidatus Uabimicrobium sp. HlEnr_7]|uniref:hypothetical protein n=1 Tax=Candidatus Uabimicrobium helgolandensis TaxID=3095367 RepID=UPI0035564A3D
MESVGVEVEEEEVQPVSRKKNTDVRTDFTEEEMIIVWDHLKKIVRKGKIELCRYMTPKKIQFILDGDDEE